MFKIWARRKKNAVAEEKNLDMAEAGLGFGFRGAWCLTYRTKMQTENGMRHRKGEAVFAHNNDAMSGVAEEDQWDQTGEAEQSRSQKREQRQQRRVRSGRMVFLVFRLEGRWSIRVVGTVAVLA
jgi:hypothetical protein